MDRRAGVTAVGGSQALAAASALATESAPFWTVSVQAVLTELRCTSEGLTSVEASARLATYGPNADVSGKAVGWLWALARRLLEPLVLVLLLAAGLSAATGDAASAGIITFIIAVSVGLDAVQEGRAAKAAEALKQSVALTAEVKRDGTFRSAHAETVVPGDVFRLRTGDVIPADALVLEASSFSANEAALTGEPYPAEKHPGVVSSRSAAEASMQYFEAPLPRPARP
jgi:P-type Mg2+ transporter